MQETEAIQDARRFMEICNACRYCEGYCAVFPAMEMRRSFSNGDLSYLANLCHDCRGCFYSCQYSPPHEFNLNLPQAFSAVRAQSYEAYAWPQPLARLFHRNGLVVSMLTALGVAGVLLLTMLLQSSEILFGTHTGEGAFYRVIPHGVMVALGTLTFVFAIVALAMGFVNFWRDAGASTPVGTRQPILTALRDIFTLRYLGGGEAGEGCNYPDEAFSNTRRWLHHAMFYGFLLCFAATCVATIYDYAFGWEAPYAFTSLPVLLGTIGGLGLLVGPAGLIALKFKRDPRPSVQSLMGMDVAFLALLFFTSLTGLVLLAARATEAMGVLLAIHLGFVLTLFLVLPYSKFVHAIYRSAALLRYAVERRRHA